jgi:broad specificity phosphatase PhoE
MQGQFDSPLTALGREQARTSATLLARLGVDAVFASPLGRVRETVAIMARDLPLPVVVDNRLQEWSAGSWSGERHADIARKWPEEWAAWEADRFRSRSPGGENFHDLMARAESFALDVAGRGDRVAVIAHGFLNRALAGVLLSLAAADILRIRQHNDTLIRIREHDAGRRADHFVGLEGPMGGLPEGLHSTV